MDIILIILGTLDLVMEPQREGAEVKEFVS
jgi:hypothetical protein